MAHLVTVDDERVRVKPRFCVGLPFKLAPTLDELYQVAIQSRWKVSSIHPLTVWQALCKLTHQVAAFMSSLRIGGIRASRLLITHSSC